MYYLFALAVSKNCLLQLVTFKKKDSLRKLPSFEVFLNFLDEKANPKSRFTKCPN